MPAKKTATPAKGSTTVAKRASHTPAQDDPELRARQQALMEEASEEAKPQFAQDDLAIPFLRVLQDLSPQVKKKDEAYVEGAEVGMFYESATKQLWEGEEEGILVIPVYHEQS